MLPQVITSSLSEKKIGKKLIKYSVVDAFAESTFKGNPAAICYVEEHRDDQWIRSVAAEINIPLTCFLTRLADSDPPNSPTQSSVPKFRLRWFSPVSEVKICGHGTLASAHSIFTSGNIDSDIIEFVTLSGVLTARKVTDSTRNGEARKEFYIELNFPADPSTEISSVEAEYPLISKAMGGASVLNIKRTVMDKIIVVLPSAKCVSDFRPDFDAIARCPGFGVLITGIAPPDSRFDFHSRFFCPKHKINEDPVCGSAHCALAPLWSKELGKSEFVAFQASARGGILRLQLDDKNQRVFLQGKARTVMEGTILVLSNL